MNNMDIGNWNSLVLILSTIILIIIDDHRSDAQQYEYKQVERASSHGKYDRFQIDFNEKCSTFNARNINETLLGTKVGVDKACQCPRSASTLFFKKDGNLCLNRSSKYCYFYGPQYLLV